MWWVLGGLPGWGPKRARQAVQRAGSLEAAVHWGLKGVENPTAWSAQRLDRLHRTLQLGAWASAWDEVEYPRGWSELADAPLVVFGRGMSFSQHRPQHGVAVVGTRKCTPEAREVAFELGKALASRGVTVVSGLARGVDAAAHRGACYAGHRTVGILGGPINQIQPQSSRPIAQRMLDLGGTVVSEHAANEPVNPWHFAARNRLVVGLSQALVLIQSPCRGGALISAELALDQGVPCWVFEPPNATSQQWKGNSDLLHQFPEMGWSSVERLAEKLAGTGAANNACTAERGIPEAFLPAWRLLMASRGLQLESLALRMALPVERMRAQLHAMEMGGWVRRLPGEWYIPEIL